MLQQEICSDIFKGHFHDQVYHGAAAHEAHGRTRAYRSYEARGCSTKDLAEEPTLMRTSIKTVTFGKAFRIAGVDDLQPPGDYEITTDEEEISDLSFTAWRRVSASIRFPRMGVASAQTQWVSVNPQDLDQVIEAAGLSAD